MTPYPTRDAFFANTFCRKLTKSAAALDLGADVCWLLTIVAMQEDSRRYRGPARFWNHQLIGVAGFGSINRLARARDRAVAAGWLHYEAGGKGKIGRYWVIIPPEYDNLPDTPCDEGEDLSVQNGQQSGHATGLQTDREPDCNRTDKPSTFLPVPKPIPKNNAPPENGRFHRNTGKRLQPSDFSHLSRGYEEFKRRETAGLIASALELQFLVLWQSAKSKDDPPSWFSKALEVGTNTNVWWGTEAAEAKARDFLRNTHKRAPPREPLPGSLNLGKPPVDLDSAHEDHD